MVPLSPEVLVRAKLQPGALFHIRFSDFPEKMHYCAVLGISSEQVVYVCVATSQLKKRLSFVKHAGLSQKTLVEIDPSGSTVFREKTIFDCTEVHEIAICDLIDKAKESGKYFLENLNSHELNQLLEGVRASDLVEQNIKEELNLIESER